MKIMEFNRKTPPPVSKVEKFELIKATEQHLDNGIPVYSINAGTQEVTKIEFIFPAGLWYQPMPLVASITNSMLNEGTKSLTAAEIAQKIDQFGAFLQMEVEKDEATITLFSLNKHVEKVLPVIGDILNNSIFPEKEFELFMKNSRQRFVINNEKMNVVASKKFNELIFGNNHPYGYNVQEEDYGKVNSQDAKEFYRRFYLLNPCKIIVAGLLPKNLISMLNKHFGSKPYKIEDQPKPLLFGAFTNKERQHFIHKADALQSVIKIGRVLFNRLHKDFQAMYFLNTILGGYFGSRLMTNIREEKGYTYGIGSGLLSAKKSGCFYISTEVGADVCSKAIHEIYFELQRLREEAIPEEELELVKNYLSGEFIRDADGPFALADRFKAIMLYNLTYDFYDEYFKLIQTITPGQLLELAQKYLRQEDMIELVVGKK